MLCWNCKPRWVSIFLSLTLSLSLARLSLFLWHSLSLSHSSLARTFSLTLAHRESNLKVRQALEETCHLKTDEDIASWMHTGLIFNFLAPSPLPHALSHSHTTPHSPDKFLHSYNWIWETQRRTLQLWRCIRITRRKCGSPQPRSDAMESEWITFILCTSFLRIFCFIRVVLYETLTGWLGLCCILACKRKWWKILGRVLVHI